MDVEPFKQIIDAECSSVLYFMRQALQTGDVVTFAKYQLHYNGLVIMRAKLKPDMQVSTGYEPALKRIGLGPLTTIEFDP